MTQPQRRPLSWEVRLATAMVGVGVLLGVNITLASVFMVRELLRRRRGARLRTGLFGGAMAVSGLMVLAASPGAGRLLVGYGGGLAMADGHPR